MNFVLASFLTLFASVSFAKTEVMFYGGYAASQSQMQCWKKGANGKYGYEYTGIAWPSGAPAGPAGAVTDYSKSQKLIQDQVAKIMASPKTHFVISGHSSGAALANETARAAIKALKKAGRSLDQIELVDLDGFRPDPKLAGTIKTSCWYAERVSKGSVTGSSRNAGGMKGCGGSGKPHSYKNATCENSGASPMCLHFSLINTQAAPNLNGKSFAQHGYDTCSTNTAWVPPPNVLNEYSENVAPPPPIAKAAPARSTAPTIAAPVETPARRSGFAPADPSSGYGYKDLFGGQR